MKELIINNTHGFTRPTKPNTTKKYRAEYGIPDYSLYLGKYADSAILRLHHEGYIVLVGGANGKDYILTENLQLVSLNGRSVLPLGSYVYDEVIIDRVTQVARIWMETHM